MPLLRIVFNTPRPAAPEALTSKLTALVVELTGKPVAVVMVALEFDQVITLGGATGPAAFVQFNSIGKVSEADNLKYTKAFGQVLADDLKIPQERQFFNFVDVPAANWGWNGMLASQLG